jgi:tetratricopeptide (TPR) repeat protein
MKKAPKTIIAGLSIVLAIAVVISINFYKSEQQDKAAEEQLVLEKGMALYNQGQYEEALHTLKNNMPDATRNWQIPYYKGAAAVRLKDYPSAATYLEQAVSLNSSDAQTLYLLGVVYYKLGNLKLSEGYFAATLEIDPAHEEAKGLMGVMADLQKMQGQPAETSQEPETNRREEKVRPGTGREAGLGHAPPTTEKKENP